MQLSSGSEEEDCADRLSSLYPYVDTSMTPLPTCWSTTDKYPYVGVSHNNVRVTYRGQGKNPKDAAAVRSNQPIPMACGVHYFEVSIVSKGRDGFMGIGLCQRDVSLNRLPGWDKFSYGYHGDDGNIFCSSGSGLPYGPTFTTGDVVGCGVNLVNAFCFYTKNGLNLGLAFSDLPNELYPTVGLQTPGEIVDTNFGQRPFVYDIGQDIVDAELRVNAAILRHPLPVTKTEWFNKLVSSYLVHRGYCVTAEVFNESTGQVAAESSTSIRTRQCIRRLVLNGRISEAVAMVNQLYPGLLERNVELHFLLLCRQFIETVAGVDSCGDSVRPSPRSSHSASPAASPPQPSSSNRRSSARGPPSRRSRTRRRRCRLAERVAHSPAAAVAAFVRLAFTTDRRRAPCCRDVGVRRGGRTVRFAAFSESMQLDEESDACHVSNGSCVVEPAADSAENGAADLMETQDSSTDCANVERLLEFGRQIRRLSEQLPAVPTDSPVDYKKMMEEAFSLLCYVHPATSVKQGLLEPRLREPVADALNGALLAELGQPEEAPLHVLLQHAHSLRRSLCAANVAACAFARPTAAVSSLPRL